MKRCKYFGRCRATRTTKPFKTVILSLFVVFITEDTFLDETEIANNFQSVFAIFNEHQKLTIC